MQIMYGSILDACDTIADETISNSSTPRLFTYVKAISTAFIFSVRQRNSFIQNKWRNTDQNFDSTLFLSCIYEIFIIEIDNSLILPLLF